MQGCRCSREVIAHRYSYDEHDKSTNKRTKLTDAKILAGDTWIRNLQSHMDMTISFVGLRLINWLCSPYHSATVGTNLTVVHYRMVHTGDYWSSVCRTLCAPAIIIQPTALHMRTRVVLRAWTMSHLGTRWRNVRWRYSTYKAHIIFTL